MSGLDGISNANKTQEVNNTTAITGGSVQLTFALLLRDIADSNKEAAMQKIQDIRDRQAESAKITETINMLRNVKIAGAREDDDKDEERMPPMGVFNSGMDPETEIEKIKKFRDDCKSRIENVKSSGDKSYDGSMLSILNPVKNDDKEYKDYAMKTGTQVYEVEAFLDPNYSGANKEIHILESREKALELRQNLLEASVKYGVQLPTNPPIKNEDIDVMIASLTAKQEEVTAGVQQEMVLVQDFMGQYSANTQGAISAISQATQTATSVAKGG